MSLSSDISFKKNMLGRLSYPSIDPVPEGLGRPFWSVMIPTYNPNLVFLEQVLESVLDQDPGPEQMQIEIVDDCSQNADLTDFIEKVGRKRILFYRQEQRTDIGTNWNTCIKRARGHWVHILHQDDLLLPGFYGCLRERIEEESNVGAAFCRATLIDANGNTKGLDPLLRETGGILDDWLEHIFISLKIKASAILVKRGVYEKLGGFSTDFDYALDWDMWKRIASSYSIWYEPESLACYRYHGKSASAGFINSGRNLVEIRRSIDISQSYLPEDISLHVSKQAKENYTKYGIAIALRILLEQGNLSSAITQLRETHKIGSNTFLNSLVGLIVDTILNVMRDLKSKLITTAYHAQNRQ